MPGAADSYDVLVIGAGPAGSTAAQLLASWGWSVALVHRAATHPALAESLPASARKLLGFLGQIDRVDAAGFHPNDGNVAHWAGAVRATRTADAGFHVLRDRFDRVLRDAAIASRVRIVDAAVQRVEMTDPLAVTCVTTGDGAATIHARHVLDCSGRSGVVARRGFRRIGSGYRTLAITAEWDCAMWPSGEQTQTAIESYDDGWAWSVPLSPTRRQSTVMIEPGRLGRPTRGTRGAGSSCGVALQAVYDRELAKAAALTSRLSGAAQVSAPWACDASIYDSTRAADEGVLLVGDAASFIEPLSSAGVKKALLSAWRAAVVTNTCLSNPALAAAAIDLYTRRERQVYADCMGRARTFFVEAAGAHDTPFWRRRAECVVAFDAIDAGSEVSDQAVASDAEVRLAFDQLRRAEHVRLRPSDALRFEPVASIEGREVVMRDALVVPGLRAPLQFTAGVNLPALARLVTGREEVPAILAAYQAAVGPVPLTALLTGLSLLVARHALVAEGSTP
ncbi:MAG: NAD(P)/FAD-dependent oxidoreductase [Vicinamibacterales bacterium]